MTVTREHERYIVDQLRAAGRITARRMFGGVGLSIDGAFCGIIAGGSGRLYLKVDEASRDAYLREGMEAFRTPRGTMSYYTVPEHVVEDPDVLREWALAARAAALRSAAHPPKARRSK